MSQIVVVGPCGSGKTTLVQGLEAHGYTARVVAQEHSIVTTLWRHQGLPTALILLDASLQVITARRGADFPAWLYNKQMERLMVARNNANLILATSDLTPGQVLHQVVEFLHHEQHQAE